MTAPAFGLNEAQVAQLMRPINPRRVLKAQGQSHVPAYDVIAHLTRIFGVGGWSFEVVSLDLIHERSTPPKSDKDQGRWWVTYRCVGRLTIRNLAGDEIARYEDAATGSAQNLPTPGDAHDFAVKNAVSYTIKRCAKDLGDQFGLSLYNKGSMAPLLGATLAAAAHDDVEAHVPTPESLGNDEVDTDSTGAASAAPVVIPDEPPVEVVRSTHADPGPWATDSGAVVEGEVPAAPEHDDAGKVGLWASDKQMRAINAKARAAGANSANDRNDLLSHILGRPVTSLKDVTMAEASALLDRLKWLEKDEALANDTWAEIGRGQAVLS